MTTDTELIRLSAAASMLLDSIRRAGGHPLIVGGAVRDALLGVAPKDIDVEVHGDTDTAVLLTEIAKVGTVRERGRSFAILAAQVNGEDFDVSLARHGEENASERIATRLAEGEHTNISDAFAQRDLTINAIGWDPASGKLIDPFGGLRDLNAGVLRATSNAFGKDPLRVWRVVQFAGRFGFQVEDNTAATCRRIALQMQNQPEAVAQERIWMEWSKLLRVGKHWQAAAAALVATGAIMLLPELAATLTVPQDPTWHPEGNVFTHLTLSAQAAADSCTHGGITGDDREVAVLGALLHDLGKVTHTQIGSVTGRITSYGHAQAGVGQARAFLHRIGAPSHIIRRVVPVVAEHMSHVSVHGTPSRPTLRRLARRLAPASLTDWARVVDADSAGRGSGAKASPAATWLSVAAADPIGTAPILKGRHLISLGLEPGPEFAGILHKALQAQDEGAFADEEGALVWARANLN
ncbi:HD domain-containing protein [Planctomonas sp. JC2975]|uniref:CCA tRNA nucleotidyltransferase n=1 Tax=Planctomonas sp. JC2975 TaxID=2729626 RepID=UPI001473264E|nr:HD domain-containing protein [Planctomonas sp. JC2975]NNC13411.1 HD domain-containing protein [Planctomonas sp. JC2975]